MRTTTLRTGFAALMAMYLVVALWVWLGSFLTSGGQTLGWGSLQIGTTIAAGMALWLLIPKQAAGWHLVSQRAGPSIALALGGSFLLLIVAHWWVLGGPPVLRAVLSGSDVGAGLVRDQITAVSVPLANYIPTLVIKAGIPFLVIYMLNQDRPGLAAILLAAGLIYAISLLQKAYPLYVLGPPAVYCLITRRWGWAAILAGLGAASIVALVSISNPSMFGVDVAAASGPKVELVLYGQAGGAAMAPDEVAAEVVSIVAWRVLVDPGLSVNQWFDAFPSVFPFTGGCSYRFLAPILGCDLIEASEVIWRHYYPALAEKGYNGSSGAAHFMEEYAAFGVAGLPLASVLVIVALFGAALVSSRSGIPLLVAMNLPFVFALSSTGLHTTMLSGGWAFALMLVALLPMSRSA